MVGSMIAESDWRLPSLSLAERDRRWARARELMAEANVDCLIASGPTGQHYRNAADVKYLTQLGHNSEEVTLLFPREGDVRVWTNPPGEWPNGNWIGATLPGGGSRVLLEALKPHFARATIGVCGLAGGVFGTVRQPDGYFPHTALRRLAENLPDARFVNAADLLGRARFVKSAEEVQFLRCATQLAERGLHALLQTARVGVFEPLIMANILQAEVAAGGTLPIMLGWISGPFGAANHRLEQPTHRLMQSGDYLMVELEGRWAGYIGQLDQSVVVGKVPEWAHDAHQAAVQSFWDVVQAMRPGVTLGELREAARKVSRSPGVEGELIMHGRGLGDDGPLALPRQPGGGELDRVALEENNVFLVKPNTIYRGHRDAGHVGDTVVVTASGAERLGTRPIEQFWRLD